MDKIILYRVQDYEGRGPYLPGFSDTWVDHDNDGENCPNEFTPKQIAELAEIAKSKFAANIGFAFRSIAHLSRWFSASELKRLSYCGYNVVEIDADAILAETPHQVLFMRHEPFRRGAKILYHEQPHSVSLR